MKFSPYSIGRSVAVASSIILFATSLALPAFRHDGSDQTAGWSALLSGWIPALIDLVAFIRGNFEDWTCIAWYANPALLTSWVCTLVLVRRFALVFGLVALGFGLVFLETKQLPMGDHSLKDVVPGDGYYLWMASMLLAIVAAALIQQRTPDAPARRVG